MILNVKEFQYSSQLLEFLPRQESDEKYENQGNSLEKLSTSSKL